ncbi:MAG TPA: hypothetical protein VJ253_03105 [Dehalococcoidia bacterium]|nr:hypothetical protein [Dehalococcoidia bacterium]
MTRLRDEIDEILAGLEPLPAAPLARPRYTGPWRRSGGQVVAELRALAVDPEICAAFNGCGILANTADPHLSAALTALLSMASERAPAALHCLGQIGMTDFMVSQLMAQAHFRAGQIAQGVNVLDAMTARLRFAYFADSPAQLRADGGVTIPPGADMTFSNFSDLRGFQDSQRPAGKAGRPKGAKDAKPRKTGRRGLNLEMAKLAWKALQQPGVTQKAIIARLWPDLDPSSSKARSRLSRLLEHYTKTLPA